MKEGAFVDAQHLVWRQDFQRQVMLNVLACVLLRHSIFEINLKLTARNRMQTVVASESVVL